MNNMGIVEEEKEGWNSKEKERKRRTLPFLLTANKGGERGRERGGVPSRHSEESNLNPSTAAARREGRGRRKSGRGRERRELWRERGKGVGQGDVKNGQEGGNRTRKKMLKKKEYKKILRLN